MKLFKLTNQSCYSSNNFLWGENVINKCFPKENPQLCSSNVIHAYESLEKALILNYIHNDIKNPVVWEAEGDVVVKAWDKVGCFELKTISRVSIPEWFSNIDIRKKTYSLIMKKIHEVALIYTYGVSPQYKTEFLNILETGDLRKLLYTVFESYSKVRKNTLDRKIADCFFVIYQNLFCQSDLSGYYIQDHISDMLETASDIGFNIDLIVGEAISDVTRA